MKRFVAPLIILSFTAAVPALAQTTGLPANNTSTSEKPLTLNDEQKQAVIDAAVAAKSRQKTPKDFSPTVGTAAPNAVFVHGFEPEATKKTPLLKEYSYAFLDREVVLLGPTRKVVAVIPLPEKLVDNEQPHQGAAEASTTAKGDGGQPTTSVPSHTSPESIK